MFEAARVRAITLDLDDTLWPVWPVIERAEQALAAWLEANAPATAALYATPGALRKIREAMVDMRPDLLHDLSGLRRESIRHALTQSGDDPALAELAFDVFFAERQKVELYEDALPTLEFLMRKFPVVAISNGNADIHKTGVGKYFRAAFSAREFGVGKPDARIFHAGAQAAGVRPAEVLHVGDDAHLDVVGALNAGMQAFWLARDGKPWSLPQQPHPHITANSLHKLAELLA
jgi:HAD superfamily hydrolase (TIGR01549 family)